MVGAREFEPPNSGGAYGVTANSVYIVAVVGYRLRLKCGRPLSASALRVGARLFFLMLL